jgi:hypothetical protein
MGHYAKVNNGIVEQVIVAKEEFFDTFVDTSPGEWFKTSYNTRGGVIYTSSEVEEASGTINTNKTPLRKNFASIGDTYDYIKDAFYKPKPYPSWNLNENTCRWEPPVAKPTDDLMYTWDEETTNWKENN